MRILYYIFLSLIFLSACIKDMNTNENYIITNNSNHKLTIVPKQAIINSKYRLDSIIILKHIDYEIKLSEPGGGPFPFHSTSILTIYFDDTLFYINYRDSLSKVPSGNLLHLEDWSGGKIDDYEYEYQFTFTDADYQEVLKLQ